MEPGTNTKRLTVAILLSSGIPTRPFSERVAKGGFTLKVTATWADLLVTLNHLHRKRLKSNWLDRIKIYLAKLIRFEHYLKSCRSRNIDSAESTDRICLPFQVQKHLFGKYNLGWCHSLARKVYAKLRRHEEQYGSLKVNSRFKIC